MKITEINQNVMIFRKIANSISKSYDCDVKFYVRKGYLAYEGDKECAEEIVKQVIELGQSKKGR